MTKQSALPDTIGTVKNRQGDSIDRQGIVDVESGKVVYTEVSGSELLNSQNKNISDANSINNTPSIYNTTITLNNNLNPDFASYPLSLMEKCGTKHLMTLL